MFNLSQTLVGADQNPTDILKQEYYHKGYMETIYAYKSGL